MIKTPGAVQASQLIPGQLLEESARLSPRSGATICSGLVVMRTKAGEGGGAPGERRLFGWGQRGSETALILENHPSALTVLEYI